MSNAPISPLKTIDLEDLFAFSALQIEHICPLKEEECIPLREDVVEKSLDQKTFYTLSKNFHHAYFVHASDSRKGEDF